jgi:enoyl-CoA hydratase/carnithine racemase
MDALRVFDKPLVGAVRGVAVGSGATMLTYFDFVVAGQSARFQYPFINLALVPEFGTSFSSPDQVGYLRAAKIILLGHPFDAPTALNLGLVTKVLRDAEVLGSAEKNRSRAGTEATGCTESFQATSAPSISTTCGTGYPGRNGGV